MSRQHTDQARKVGTCNGDQPSRCVYSWSGMQVYVALLKCVCMSNVSNKPNIGSSTSFYFSLSFYFYRQPPLTPIFFFNAFHRDQHSSALETFFPGEERVDEEGLNTDVVFSEWKGQYLLKKGKKVV